MIRLLANIFGMGLETADMLVREILSRNLRDRRAVARYAGLTGSPNASANKKRERGLAKAGNPRVRRGLTQLAWCFIRYQKNCSTEGMAMIVLPSPEWAHRFGTSPQKRITASWSAPQASAVLTHAGPATPVASLCRRPCKAASRRAFACRR
jgi:hypothetical protein